ncbi:variable large family protein [Borrelia turcica]|uniref:variable large family protein n=1 Tax=Borrelia turcica TaxID=229155 RepID=UPI00137520AA|nr:variable large family protein [Borrelia turcica]
MKATASDAITLFANKGTGGKAEATEAAGNAAATIVAKATGEGMLKAIADDATAEPTKAVRLAGGYAAGAENGATSAADADITAVVGSDGVTELSDDIFAGAVALRAITKTGKFGAKGAADAQAAIGGAASAAVNKLLGALMYAIKSGVEKDIKKIQESIAKIKSDGSSKKTDIVKEDTKNAITESTKAVRLADDGADGVSNADDKDIEAIVGKTTEKNLADDVFAEAALKAITDNIAGADAAIAPSADADGPTAADDKDKIKGEAGKIAGAIKTIIDLVLPDAKLGEGTSEVVKAPKKAAASDAITLFATSATGANTQATETAGNAAATIVAKATGEGMLKAIADATTAPAKAVALAGGYAATVVNGASAADADITAVVGSDGATTLSDDVFAVAAALKAITANITGGAEEATIAPSAAGAGPANC